MNYASVAEELSSKGRNGDSMLVHMTPGEVGGLQNLAMAAGGSLTINPDTGLVEANFLKKLLPTLLGVGLSAAIPGLGPLAAAGIIGGGQTLLTGDINKGLMAGLQAFGGASLAGGLGVGVVSRHALHGHQKENGVSVIDVQGFPLPSAWHIVYPAGKKLSPLALAFKQHVLKQISRRK